MNKKCIILLINKRPINSLSHVFIKSLSQFMVLSADLCHWFCGSNGQVNAIKEVMALHTPRSIAVEGFAWLQQSLFFLNTGIDCLHTTLWAINMRFIWKSEMAFVSSNILQRKKKGMISSKPSLHNQNKIEKKEEI